MFMRCWMCKGRWVSFRSWRRNICCKRCSHDLGRMPMDPALADAVHTMEGAIPAPPYSAVEESYRFNARSYTPASYAESARAHKRSSPSYGGEPSTSSDDTSTPDTTDFTGGGGDFGGGGASGDF